MSSPAPCAVWHPAAAIKVVAANSSNIIFLIITLLFQVWFSVDDGFGFDDGKRLPRALPYSMGSMPRSKIVLVLVLLLVFDNQVVCCIYYDASDEIRVASLLLKQLQ